MCLTRIFTLKKRLLFFKKKYFISMLLDVYFKLSFLSLLLYIPFWWRRKRRLAFFKMEKEELEAWTTRVYWVLLSPFIFITLYTTFWLQMIAYSRLIVCLQSVDFSSILSSCSHKFNEQETFLMIWPQAELVVKKCDYGSKKNNDSYFSENYLPCCGTALHWEWWWCVS